MWGYQTKIRELAWDFSSRYLATGGSPVVCIWDCQAGPKGPEGSKPQMLEGHDEDEHRRRWRTRRAGSCSRRRRSTARVLLWQPTNKKGPQIGEFKFPGGEASVLAWSPDDKSPRRRLRRGRSRGVPRGVSARTSSSTRVSIRTTQRESSCGRTWEKCWSSGRGSAAGGSPARPGKGYAKRVHKCLDAGDSPPAREGMKHCHGHGTKHFNEHLAPLRRFLESNVGRPWNKVYSEICQYVDRGNVVQKHILTHLFEYVAVHTILIDGEPCRE